MSPRKSLNASVGALVSVFCGAGGLDLGFSQAGFKSILAIDNDAFAVDTFNTNFDSGVAVQVDLSTLRTSKFLDLVAHAVNRNGERPVGLIGGPPCQGVSTSNVEADPADPRNSLMTTYLRMLNALEETYGIDFFVFENVPGLLNQKNRPRFTRLKKELSRRFHITVQKVDAAKFGVPQHRERVIICGLNRKKFDAPMPLLKETNTELLTVRHAIGHLVEPAFFKRGADSSTFPLHPNHWTMNPKSAKFQQVTTTVGRSFRMLNWDLPSRTVAYGHREIHIHPKGHRRLSIYEGMLLQGFPVKFLLKGTLSSQVQQVSNAVPPPLAKTLARHVNTTLRGAKNDANRG